MHYSRCVTVIQGCPEASQDSPPRDPVPDAQVQREAAPGPRIHTRGAQVRRRQQEDGADHRHLRRPAQVTTVRRIRISFRPMFINMYLVLQNQHIDVNFFERKLDVLLSKFSQLTTSSIWC